MKTVTIEGTLRTDIGKKANNDLRRQDMVPCVVYGGTEVVHFYAHTNAFKSAIYTPEFNIIEIKVGDKTLRTIVKDRQFHPVSDKLLHVDFLELVEGRKLQANIPLRLTGVAKGVREGGTLVQKLRRVQVITTPDKLVDSISVDVSALELGKSMRVRNISIAEGMEITQAPSLPIVSIDIPRALRSAQAAQAKDSGKKK